MPGWTKVVLTLALAFALWPAASSHAALKQGCTPDGPAAGTQQRYTCLWGPVDVAGYEVRQDVNMFDVPTPGVDGAITDMDVDVVDPKTEKVMPITRLMLHHVVFANLGERVGQRFDGTCGTFTMFDNQTKLPAVAERFYGAGEERAELHLPPGYGYRVGAKEKWLMVWMFMNHRKQPDTAMVRYRVTLDTAPATTNVKPYWLDVANCLTDPIYDVAGGRPAGSVDRKTVDWTVPRSGRLIAGGGHVHGGGRLLTLTQPGCGDRELARSTPAWGNATHPFYTVKPVLHEPGPISMSMWSTAQGIPLAKGETVRLTSEYDGAQPHTRVMGVKMVYLAPDEGVTTACGALPGDLAQSVESRPHRSTPPPFTVPLTGLDARGRAIRIDAPKAPTHRMPKGGRVEVRDTSFTKRNLVVGRGATVSWRFGGKQLHDVTLASGPRGFSSPHLTSGRTFSQRFTTPGTYRLFCSLHPVAMTATVKVR